MHSFSHEADNVGVDLTHYSYTPINNNKSGFFIPRRLPGPFCAQPLVCAGLAMPPVFRGRLLGGRDAVTLDAFEHGGPLELDALDLKGLAHVDPHLAPALLQCKHLAMLRELDVRVCRQCGANCVGECLHDS